MVTADPARLTSWRQLMGYSQRQAAASLGCSRDAWRAWESGQHRVPRYIVLACEALLNRQLNSPTQ